MNVEAIVERVQSQMQSTFGSRVAGAAELSVALRNPEQTRKPHAFVVWTADVQETQSPVPGQQARFREEFSVVVLVDGSADARGDSAVESIDDIGTVLKLALVGWTPSTAHLPVTFAGSSLSDLTPAQAVHSFQFAAVVPGGSVHRFQLRFTARLLTGVSVADVLTLYESKVEAVLGASTRLDSDYLLDREAIAEGATRYQLRMVPAGVDDRQDSSGALTHLTVMLDAIHHFAPGATERDYTESTMIGYLTQLLPRSYWRDSTKIHSIEDGPTLALGADLSRE